MPTCTGVGQLNICGVKNEFALFVDSSKFIYTIHG